MTDPAEHYAGELGKVLLEAVRKLADAQKTESQTYTLHRESAKAVADAKDQLATILQNMGIRRISL